MPVIVFSKRTSKYLRRHSGSFNYAMWRQQCKNSIKEIIEEKFGPYISWRDEPEKCKEQRRNIRQFLEDLLFNAEPGDARVYATEGSAATSVGILDRDKNNNRTYRLSDHLEVHEIKESFVCVMRPDGSSNCDDGGEEQDK